MQRNITHVTLLSIFLLSYNLFAQQANANITNDNVNFRNLIGRSGFVKELEKEGSPYIYDEYKKAKIANNSQLYDLKYNAYKDEIEVLNNGKTMTIFKNPEYSPIYLIDSNEYIYLKNYNYGGKNVSGYLFELKKINDLIFYMKISKSYFKGKRSESSFDRDQPESYTDEPDVFFVQKANGEILEMPKTKSKLIEMFPDKKEKIEKTIKVNKIDTKNVNVLSQIFTTLS